MLHLTVREDKGLIPTAMKRTPEDTFDLAVRVTVYRLGKYVCDTVLP